MRYRPTRQRKISRSFAESVKCQKCGSKNKTVDALVIDGQEVGYQTKCCMCGNTSTIYMDMIYDNFYQPVAKYCKHIKYGGIRFGKCHHATNCKLNSEGKCRCAFAMPLDQRPIVHTHHHHDCDECNHCHHGEEVTITVDENTEPKYR